MSSRKLLVQAAAGAEPKATNVEDVFSTYLYEGTGATLDINNGINLYDDGGLVWIKKRDDVVSHGLYDTVRGTNKLIKSDSSDAETSYSGVSFVDLASGGFRLGTGSDFNQNGNDHVSWSFKKTPRFFDVVSYTGDGTSATSRSISHELGCAPGLIFIKRLDSASDWVVNALNASGTYERLGLNSTSPSSGTQTGHTSETFHAISGSMNVSGGSYVAYLFADNNDDGRFGPDLDADIIKCGGYTGNGTVGKKIDLGFEPQWVLIKRASGGNGNWILIDNMRGCTTVSSGTTDSVIRPNTNDAEYLDRHINLDATGFILNDFNVLVNGSGDDYIYMAIRRGPMAVPTNADDVFEVEQTSLTTLSTGSYTGSIFTDWMFARARISVGSINWFQSSRLSPKTMAFNSTGAEQSTQYVDFARHSGVYWQNTWVNTTDHHALYYFKRAPSFFDVVLYEGDGVAGRTVSHNLGVAPEMIWAKPREQGTADWGVYHSALGNEGYVELNTNGAALTGQTTILNSTDPAATEFTVGTQFSFNGTNEPIVAYLFASLSGISKVGSYTGNGTSQNIDCGFSSGARLILIKGSSFTHGWKVFDTERGIVAGGDPYFQFHLDYAQVSGYDAVDPYSLGFAVRDDGGGASGAQVNNSGETYIFYAIA